MKKQYDFSKGEKGKFYIPENEIELPVYLDENNRKYYSELASEKKIAMSNIEFLGNLTDMELLRYYKGSSALVFPTNEDFGLAILEAQMFGKPVIAFRKGGALETIIDGKTGEFFYPQHEDALIKTLQGFIGKKYKISDCIKQAEKFNKERFKQQFLESINRFFREIKK